MECGGDNDDNGSSGSIGGGPEVRPDEYGGRNSKVSTAAVTMDAGHP